MTAEFSASPGVKTSRTYLALPTLDHSAPEMGVFRQVVQDVASWDGPVYIHCALGRGRSALVAAVMVVRGDAESQAEAFTRVRQKRGVKWNTEQSEFLTRFTGTL